MPWLGETIPSYVHDLNDTQHVRFHTLGSESSFTHSPPQKNNHLIREKNFQTTSKNTSRTHQKQTNSIQIQVFLAPKKNNWFVFFFTFCPFRSLRNLQQGNTSKRPSKKLSPAKTSVFHPSKTHRNFWASAEKKMKNSTRHHGVSQESGPFKYIRYVFWVGFNPPY